MRYKYTPHCTTEYDIMSNLIVLVVISDITLYIYLIISLYNNLICNHEIHLLLIKNNIFIFLLEILW